MLRALSIQNFILIDELLVEFKNGLTIFTGETGAGKSIILDALNLAIGSKANDSFIRNKNKPTVISAEFEISNIKKNISSRLLEYAGEEDRLILKRIITADGKSRAFINSAISNISTLKEISTELLEICGQHQHYGLFNEQQHILILDSYAGINKKELEQKFKKYQIIKKDLLLLIEQKKKSESEKAYLDYVIKEITDLDYINGEEEKLEIQRKQLNSLEKIKEVSNLINEVISGDNNNVLSALYMLQKNINKIPQNFESISKQLVDTCNLLEEIVIQNNNLTKGIFSEGIDLDKIENRLFKIKEISRKYSISISQLPAFLTEKINALKDIKDIDESISNYQDLLNITRSDYIKTAVEISKIRKATAIKLQESIVSELKIIKMEKADFLVKIEEKTEEKWSNDGIDEVKFKIKTNPGMPFGQISDIASGGELSRIMLACKVVLQNSNLLSTMIFDEIDSGISGSVSSSVGRKLLEISKDTQVLLVTHQPQVAIFANHHYVVNKSHDNITNETIVKINLLTQEDRYKEIARMLSGDSITIEAENAAKSLFKNKLSI
jgi:DNA repair protein RecN (Recombination protein N)